MNFPLKLNVTKEKWVLLGILVFFATFYSLIVFVNHHLFRTYTGDLSYYGQAIYYFSKFRFGEYNLTYGVYTHTFGDHFEPILMLIAPLRYLFGQYTLLIVQIAAVLMGAVGIYRYVGRRTDRRWLPHLAAFYFCSFWGIYGALSFDFHTSVLGAMMVPWLFDAYERKKWGPAAIWFILFLMCGEKLAGWGIFIGFGMALLHRKDKKLVIAALAASVFSLIWMMVAVKFIIPPLLKPGQEYRHFRLTEFGPDLKGALLNMLERPVFTIKALFFNHLEGKPHADNLKMEAHKMVILSGGLILLWRPQYLVMLIPVYVGKMLNDLTAYWGINMHYSIEFVPIISIALFGWLVKLKNPRWQYGLAIFVAVLTLTSTIVSFSTRYLPHHKRENIDIFYSGHWERSEFDPADIYEALALIPPDAKVSATDRITPHLVMRETLYRFPKVEICDYIVINRICDGYPLDQQQTLDYEKKFMDTGNWEIILSNNTVDVLRRIRPDKPGN